MSYWGSRKPPLGTPIDWSHPLTVGLVECWTLAEGGGPTLRGSVRGTALGANFGDPALDRWTPGPALTFDGATGLPGFARITTPTILRLAWPVTIVWRGALLSSSTGDRLFGSTYDQALISPYHACNIYAGSSGDVGLGMNLGGTNTFFSAVDSFYAGRITVGPTHTIAGRWAAGFGDTIAIFADGSLMASMNPALSNPTYAANSEFGFGQMQGTTSAYTHSRHEAGWVYSRGLSGDELGWIAAEPYAMHAAPHNSRRIFLLSPPPQALSRRTLYDRAGSRGVA